MQPWSSNNGIRVELEQIGDDFLRWVVKNQNRTSELKHYGVLGMKWGVRNDQKPKGRKRKSVIENNTPDNGRSDGTNNSSSNISIDKNGKVTVTNPSIKGCSVAYFKDLDQYERWQKGKLTGGEVASLTMINQSYTTQGSMGSGKQQTDLGTSEDTRYIIQMGEKNTGLSSDISLYFDNKEDAINYGNEIVENYRAIVEEWLKENGYDQNSENTKMGADELEKVLSSMDESEREALNNLLGYALSGSGVSPDDFIQEYIKSLR